MDAAASDEMSEADALLFLLPWFKGLAYFKLSKIVMFLKKFIYVNWGNIPATEFEFGPSILLSAVMVREKPPQPTPFKPL